MKLHGVHQTLFYVTALFLFYAVLILNCFHPYLPGDDILYSLKFPSEGFYGEGPIRSVTDYFESQINHYNNYNYRILPHAVLQLLLIPGSIFFDVINALAFLVYINLLLNRAGPSSKSSKRLGFLFLLVLVFLTHPDFWWSYLWMSGSLNYFWSLIIQVLLIFETTKYFNREKYNRTALLGLALLVAATNEHVIFAMLLAFLVMAIVKRKNGMNKVIVLSYVSILTFGALAISLSPAFSQRLNSEMNASFFEAHHIENLMRMVYYIIKCAPLILLSFVFSLKKQHGDARTYYLLLFSFSLIPGILSPLFEPRLFVFSYTIILMYILEGSHIRARVNWLLMTVVAFIAGLVYFNRLKEARALDIQTTNMYDFLEKSVGAEDTLIYKPICSYKCTWLKNCDDISQDYKHFHNRTLASKYRIAAIKAEVIKQEPPVRLTEDSRDEKGCTSVNMMLHNDLYLREVCLTKQSGEGSGMLYISFESDHVIQQDLEIIVRGIPKKSGDIISRLLPQAYRIYFADYLEGGASIDRQPKTYNLYIPLLCPQNYHEFLVSAYSKSKHAAIGKIYSLDVESLSSDIRASE